MLVGDAIERGENGNFWSLIGIFQKGVVFFEENLLKKVFKEMMFSFYWIDKK